MSSILTFFPLCYAVAFVCTAVKESDRDLILAASLKLFLYIVGGIAAFALVVQLLTALLG
ncbi:MAG: hypothetical protein P1V97_25725 [Planctomycetota bacterium]|nr:hypothetical protein [Planctomycetota bacterium]